jgi:exodeoxyribonuclease-3
LHPPKNENRDQLLLLAWLQAKPVDALALQELKLSNDKFPLLTHESAP